MSKRKIKCARCLNERPIYDHANHHCEACFLITNNANLSALASLERLKEERDRIAAAVAVLQSIKPDTDSINVYRGDDFTNDQANRISEGVDKAMAILEGREVLDNGLSSED